VPIPQGLLSALLRTTIDVKLDTGSLRIGEGSDWALPAELSPVAWGIAPGLGDPDREGSRSLADLDHRLRQAGVQSVPADFSLGGQQVEGRLLVGLSRARALSIGYKFREWAMFRLGSTGMNVVYTGHNSRAR